MRIHKSRERRAWKVAVGAAVDWATGYLAALAICCLITLCCGGCRSARGSVSETVVRDSVREVLVERVDSVRDSIYVSLIERGDTVWVREYRDRNRYIVRHDTLRVVARDTVRVTAGVTKSDGGNKQGYGLASMLVLCAMAITVITIMTIYGRRKQGG